MKSIEELEELQKTKDSEAGVYFHGRPLPEMVEYFRVGHILIVSKTEKWIGTDSREKVRIELTLVGNATESSIHS